MTRRLRRTGTLALLAALAAVPTTAGAAVITVTTTQPGVNADAFCSLQEAIYSANFDSNTFIDPGVLAQGPITVGCESGNGEDIIVLQPGAVYTVPATAASIVADPFNYMGPTATPIIFSPIIIEGNGARFERPNANRDFTGVLFRAFAVGRVEPIGPTQGGVTGKSGNGALTLRNLHVRGFEVKGGNGASGGGGGMGAGGAIYASVGSLTIQNCTFENNGALGGRGATAVLHVGGGGGGLGGNGGLAAIDTFSVHEFGSGAGGGGGGARGDGGANGVVVGNLWSSQYGGGGGGTLSAGEHGVPPGGAGGYRCGGAGGDYDGDGHDAICGGGGGGGGGMPNSVTGAFEGDGGWGGYGGGGGGGGFHYGLNDFSSHGGRGGFGGGGGAASENDYGGSSLFGGGGGAGTDDPGAGGPFGGDASAHHGGGGAALGGAIFTDRTWLVIENSTFVGNYVVKGRAPRPTEEFPDTAQDGSNRGGAVFVRGSQAFIRHSTFSGNESAGQNPAIHVYPWIDPDVVVPLTRLHLYNTIIAKNIPATNECQVRSDVVVEGSGNLIGTNDGCPGVVSSLDPLLGPLQLNAPGLTPTMAIGLDSPAYDKADGSESLSIDQRGVFRPQSLGYDIGAYEYVKPSADLAISKTTVGEPIAGTYFSWAIDLINFGPTSAKSVSIVDTLPAGLIMSSAGGSGGFACQWTNAQVTCTNPEMQAGDIASLTITAFIPPGFVAQSLVNTATVSSTTPDPGSSNNTATVTANVRKEADVMVTTVGPPIWVAGTDASYSIVVTNNGPSNAVGLVLGDELPGGTTFVSMGPAGLNGWSCNAPAVGATGTVSCTRASALSPGSTSSLTLTVHSAPSMASGAALCNTAGVSANTLDRDLTNNTSRSCATVQTQADLALVQPTPTVSGSPGKGIAAFTLTVTNGGASDSQGVQLLARSSAFSGLQPAISVSSAGTCTVSGSDIACTWPSVALNATESVVVTIPWRSAQGDVCVAGSVSAGTLDPDAANNAASACIAKRR